MGYKKWKSLIESMPLKRKRKIKERSNSIIINETMKEAHELFKLELITLDEYEKMVEICKAED